MFHKLAYVYFLNSLCGLRRWVSGWITCCWNVKTKFWIPILKKKSTEVYQSPFFFKPEKVNPGNHGWKWLTTLVKLVSTGGNWETLNIYEGKQCKRRLYLNFKSTQACKHTNIYTHTCYPPQKCIYIEILIICKCMHIYHTYMQCFFFY